ncbi:MAG: hypothetical protein Q9164_002698 [Protoblastenia rupestris]
MTSFVQRATTSIPRRLHSTSLRPSIYSPPRGRYTRLYHEKVLDHYSSPRNVGSLLKSDVDVGTGLVGAPACGDVMKLQIRVDKDTNRIQDVKFKTFGCGSAIASSSYMTTLVQGMTLEEAARVKNSDVAKELCLPPVKSDYNKKNPKLAATDLSGTDKSLAEMKAANV